MGIGAPKLSKHKQYMCALPTMTPQGFSLVQESLPLFHYSQRGTKRLAPVSLWTSFHTPEPGSHCPGPLPAPPVPQMWLVAPCAGCTAEVGGTTGHSLSESSQGQLLLVIPAPGLQLTCPAWPASLMWPSHPIPLTASFYFPPSTLSLSFSC